MALTFLPGSLVIESDSSILDLPVFHASLRDWEDSEAAAVYPVTHTWKALDLGGGAFFYGLQLINGWQLRFPVPGNYQISGNLGGTILPVAGVYVERRTSAAYATTTAGGGGLPPDQAARLERIEKLLRNKQVTDPAAGRMVVYDDDGATPLLAGDLFEDAAGTQPYRGQGAERRERLA